MQRPGGGRRRGAKIRFFAAEFGGFNCPDDCGKKTGGDLRSWIGKPPDSIIRRLQNAALAARQSHTLAMSTPNAPVWTSVLHRRGQEQ